MLSRERNFIFLWNKVPSVIEADPGFSDRLLLVLDRSHDDLDTKQVVFAILMPILRNGHLQVQGPGDPRKGLLTQT